VFDGDLRNLPAWVRYGQRLTNGRVIYRPCQEAAADFPTIAPETFERAIWLIEPDVRVYLGSGSSVPSKRFSEADFCSQLQILTTTSLQPRPRFAVNCKFFPICPTSDSTMRILSVILWQAARQVLLGSFWLLRPESLQWVLADSLQEIESPLA
jgi:hypothetical protein